MLTIELYTAADADEDVGVNCTPAEASLRKWECIHTALDVAHTIVGSACGFCLASDECDTCEFGQRFKQCLDADSQVLHAASALRKALTAARAVIDEIKELKEIEANSKVGTEE